MRARTAESGGMRHTPSPPSRAAYAQPLPSPNCGACCQPPNHRPVFPGHCGTPHMSLSNRAPPPLHHARSTLTTTAIVVARRHRRQSLRGEPPPISLSPRTLFLAAAVLRCCGTRPWRSPRRSNHALPLPPPPHLMWQAPSPSSLCPLFLPPLCKPPWLGLGRASPAALLPRPAQRPCTAQPARHASLRGLPAVPRHDLVLPRCGRLCISRGVPPAQPLVPLRDVPWHDV